MKITAIAPEIEEYFVYTQTQLSNRDDSGGGGTKGTKISKMQSLIALLD
jgi:hypothetical protein